MSGEFEAFFRSSVPARDKYLSRLFGLFSENVVRAWCACPDALYEDLGRPTLCEHGLTRGHTLDFTLRSRATGKAFVAELKCELEYENYRYLQLISPTQLDHHSHSLAFSKLLRVAMDASSLDVRRGGRLQSVDGAVLVRGATTPSGCEAVRDVYGFADVLSVEQMINDMSHWKPEHWLTLVDRYQSWTDELFGFLGRPSWSSRLSAQGGFYR